MGHRRHRRDRDRCGCERKGCFGGCGWGGGYRGGFGPQFGPQNGGFGPGYGPRFGAEHETPVVLPNGTTVMAPVPPNGGMMASPAQMAALAIPAPPAQMTFTQAVMGQYIMARNAAGFPVTPLIAPVGFQSKKIRKHATRTVVARPGSFYSPKEIHISCDVAKHFEICEISVGQHSVLGGRDPISAEMYSGFGPVVIQLPPMLPGQHVYLTVRNHTSHSHWFRGSLNGIILA